MEIKPNYPSTESALYSITGTVCQTCLDSIDAFSAFKAKYTPPFLEGILKQASIAQQMPNNAQRQSTSVALRKLTVAANKKGCDNFVSLMKFVEDSFPQSDWDNKKKAAGNSYYGDAAHNKFQAATTMNGMALDFIKTYATELAAGSMPDDFAEMFADDSNRFAKALGAFIQSKGISENATADKINANNQLFANLQGILNDGKYIFRDNSAMKKQFSYTALLRKVKKNGKTGFRIAVIDTVTLLPISTAIISIVQGAKTIPANEKGIIIVRLSEGTYNYTITAPGFTLVEGAITVVTGITHREKIMMSKASSNIEVA